MSSKDKGPFGKAEIKQHAWLGMLAEAYRIADEGVVEVTRQAEEHGHSVACRKGCAACCRAHTEIPVFQPEVMGITWYVVEKLQGPVRERLHQQLVAHTPEATACPFLIDDACSVHPVRPLACRQFNVLDRVCEEGEDAWYTRRDDVLMPLDEYKHAALGELLPFHGITDPGSQQVAVLSGRAYELARALREYDWSQLAQKMEKGKAEG